MRVRDRLFVRVRDREIVRRSERARFRDYASGFWGVCCVCVMCVRERGKKEKREFGCVCVFACVARAL